MDAPSARRWMHFLSGATLHPKVSGFNKIARQPWTPALAAGGLL
jgi:hypothetical protein